jgi:hypothetical protein
LNSSISDPGSGIFLALDPRWKNSDPGSAILKYRRNNRLSLYFFRRRSGRPAGPAAPPAREQQQPAAPGRPRPRPTRPLLLLLLPLPSGSHVAHHTGQPAASALCALSCRNSGPVLPGGASSEVPPADGGAGISAPAPGRDGPRSALPSCLQSSSALG